MKIWGVAPQFVKKAELRKLGLKRASRFVNFLFERELSEERSGRFGIALLVIPCIFVVCLLFELNEGHHACIDGMSSLAVCIVFGYKSILGLPSSEYRGN